jgi:branched-chain amino acid transport system permease protein
MTKELAFYAQQFLNVTQLSTFYVPLAVAFALIQSITRKVFLSFGQVAMFGSFAAIYCCYYALLNGVNDFPAALLSLGCAIIVAGAFGYGAAQAVFQPLLNKSTQAFMIASIGFSIVVEEVMRLQTGGRDVWIPALFDGQMIVLWSGENRLQITMITGLAIIMATLCVGGLALLLAFTRFGRNWRACSQELSLARLCGVDTQSVIRQTFMVGAGLSAVSGWIVSVSYGGTNFSAGLMLGFKAMFASVVGGFGSIKGAILGAISLAILEVLWSSHFSTAYRDVGVFSFIIMVLLLRPEGLAGLSEKRESEML